MMKGPASGAAPKASPALRIARRWRAHARLASFMKLLPVQTPSARKLGSIFSELLDLAALDS
jgi:hypothetical protein